MALNLEQIKVINWIEEWWLRKDSFPPVGAFNDFFPGFSLEESLKNEIFLAALEYRGIKLPDADDHLTNEQLAGIAVISNFRDTRTPTAKLRALGITWTKWQGWMRNKHFRDFLRDLCGTNFAQSLDVAQAGILRAVEKGNIDAAKFYLEITGHYTPQSQEVVNLKLVLARIMETIQIHVKDPNTLRSIATDFERIMQGGLPTERKELSI